MAKMRLQKILSAAGIGSRRACEAYLTTGRVTVDGIPVTRVGTQADPDVQVIALDGSPIRMPTHLYYLLNKPVGYVCSNKADRSGRPLAIDLIRQKRIRLFCVGRLDVDSKGAIILTNDGDLSNYITHPRYNISKTYRVRVEGEVSAAVLEKIRKGAWLAEGRTGEIEAKVIRGTRKDTLLRIVVKEGKNRIIRRVLAKMGLRVTELERTRIGDVALGKLKPGDYRELKSVEIKRLKGGKKR